MKQHVILGISWVLFCVMHSFFANTVVKKWIAGKLKSVFRFYRLYYSLVAAATFIAVLVYQLNIFSPNIFKPSPFSYATGLLLGGTGLLLMAVCIKKYFSQLSGLKTLFTDEIRSGNTLIITGIHRHVRHPLYLGTFLFIWGLFIFLPLTSILISNFIITLYTLIAIGLEEQKLIKEFGPAYLEYRKKVPKIIPTLKLPPAN